VSCAAGIQQLLLGGILECVLADSGAMA